MSELIGSNLGPYRILELIGRGGMAAIYKAHQPSTDRLVAVKVLLDHRAEDPQIVDRFEREARVITALEHTNIVPVYDFGREGGLLYLVMRYMRAGTVNDLLKRGPLTPRDAASILSDVAAALDYAHERGVIHRDVKPNNILVDAGGRANLTDFGLAKVLGESLDLTRSGATIGTPAYMAPEHATGGTVSPRTDVYSLGVMLYEMVTGVLPYVSDSPMAVVMMHLHEEMRPPRQVNPTLPPAVEAVIVRAMLKDPVGRFATAGEMARALAQVVDGMPHTAAPGEHVADRFEQVTLVPQGSTLHLIELAAKVAEAKSPDEITPEIRRALKRMQGASRRRRLLALAPWAVAGLLMVILAVTLPAVVRGSGDSRASAAGTATAVQALVMQFAEAQTAMAAGGPNAQATLAQLQTQIAVASFTAGPTLSPTPTPMQATSTSRPEATSAPPSATEQPKPTSVLPPVIRTRVPDRPTNLAPIPPSFLP